MILASYIKFGDGSEFNATAVKWNFDRLLYFLTESSVKPPRAEMFYRNGILIPNRCEIIDRYTVKYYLNIPCAPFIRMLADPIMYILKPNDAIFHTPIGDHPEKYLIGTGPYIPIGFRLEDYTAYERRSFFDLTANPYYWDGPQKIKNVEFIYYGTNKMLQFGDISAGKLDLTYANPNLRSYEGWNESIAEHNMTVETVKTGDRTLLLFRPDEVPVEIRKAISLVINYDELLDFMITNVSNNGNIIHSPLYGPIPRGMTGSDLFGRPAYNLTEARRLMLEAAQRDPRFAAPVNDYNISMNSSDYEWTNASYLCPFITLNLTANCFLYNYDVEHKLELYLRKIGINVDFFQKILDFDWMSEEPIPNAVWIIQYGGEYYDPIAAVEPLFYSNSSENYMGFNDTVLDGYIDDYYESGDMYSDMIPICERFNKTVPAIYLSQLNILLIYNNATVKKADGLNNILTWPFLYDVEFNPPPTEDYGLLLLLTVSGIAGIVSVTGILIYRAKRKG